VIATVALTIFTALIIPIMTRLFFYNPISILLSHKTTKL
jgi:hypothetical protein